MYILLPTNEAPASDKERLIEAEAEIVELRRVLEEYNKKQRGNHICQ